MKKRVINQFIWLLVAALPVAPGAQPLQELLEEIPQRNAGLRSLDYAYEAAQYQVGQADAYPDLQLNGGVGVMPVETRLGAQVFKVGAMQMFPVSGQRKTRRKLAFSKADVLKYREDLALVEMEYLVKVAYYQLAFLARKSAIFSRQLKNLSTLETISRIRVESGKGKLSDLILVQRKIEQLRSDSALIAFERTPFMIRINRILNRPPDARISVMQEAGSASVDTSMVVLSRFPRIITLDQQKTVSDHEIRMTEIQGKPQFSVGLDYAWIARRKDVELSSNGRDVLMPMAGVRIPIPNGQFEARRNEERLKKESVDLLKEDLYHAYRAEVSSAQNEMEAARANIRKYENLVSISEDALELMKGDYATEGRKFEELLRVQLEVLEYELAIEKEKLRMQKAGAQVEKFIPKT